MDETKDKVEIPRTDTGELAHLASLCATVLDLTEQGFTIDGETLAGIRKAINIPRIIGDPREYPELRIHEQKSS